MSSSASTFGTLSPLFLEAPDSELRRFLDEVHSLADRVPALLELVEADLDAHGKAKKALRLADEDWARRRTMALPGFDADDEVVRRERATLALGAGRPRTPARVVLVAVMLRGYLGAGFKACDVSTLMQESRTVFVFFETLGMKMPAGSTLTELANAVTNPTRERILDAQIARVAELEWDTFSTLLQDSTHVEGNTAWPTDSRVALVERVLHLGAKLPQLALPELVTKSAGDLLRTMARLARELDLAPKTAARPRVLRRLYGKLLWRARRVRTILYDAVTRVEVNLALLDAAPSRKDLASRATGRLRRDVEALGTAITQCEARVVREEKLPVGEKVLSISDPDAGFIAKWQRIPVMWYKPQVARSAGGFVTGLLLPRGNAADSAQLVPMLDQVMRRTSATPKVVSVDDGYASRANVVALRARGIEVVSIHGAKGRALTEEADWSRDEYQEARALRSAVESLIVTLKQGFSFGYVARRGLEHASGELLEKAIAYNFCRMAHRRTVVPNRELAHAA